MIKRIVPYTQEWELAVAKLAHIMHPNIIPCRVCGYPIVRDYSCMFCKSESPTEEQRQEFQTWLQNQP